MRIAAVFILLLAFMHPPLFVQQGGSGGILEKIEEKEYLTDAFGREAAAFVDRHKDRPFFLYLPFNAVHDPLEASPALAEKFAGMADPKRRTYATMLAAMDDAVGRVLAKLREHAIEEETMIFFFSDNGGPTAQTTPRNDPFSGFKGQMLEGGIRIPFAMHRKAGLERHAPILAAD